MRSDDTEDHRRDYVAALETEAKMRAERGEPDADVLAELRRVLGGKAPTRTGTKATRLKGEGRTG